MKEIYFERIRKLMEAKDYMGASIEASALLRIYSDDLNLLELCKFLFAQVFENSNVLNPSNSIEFTAGGITHLYKQDINSAIEDFSMAIALDNKNDLAYSHRAFCYKLLNRSDLVKANLFKALEINPKATYYLDIGDFYYEENEPEVAIVYYLKAIDKKSDDPVYHYKAALSYLALNNSKNAILMLDKAIHLYPEYLEAKDKKDEIYKK